MITIIIPALNEEEYLPVLLKSVEDQGLKDYEIIVADAGSKDKTRKIAKSFGAKVVKGGLPAAGRNRGAKAAKKELLLFLDADVKLPKDFLKKTIGEFHKRKLDVATCFYKPQSRHLADHAIMNIMNAWTYLSQFFWPHAIGVCIFAKRDIHNKLNGFDETIKIAEDMDYVNRAGKIGKFRVLHAHHVLVSMRRYEKKGRLKMILNYLGMLFYRMFRGEIRDNKTFDYEFGKFKKKG